MTDNKGQFKECIELMQRDVAEFEAKYQGRFAEQPHVGLGNRKTRCVNEATLPIITCHPSCLEKCAGTCRNCAEHGCGCCGTGDIRFNVVGEGDWAIKAAKKAVGNNTERGVE